MKFSELFIARPLHFHHINIFNKEVSRQLFYVYFEKNKIKFDNLKIPMLVLINLKLNFFENRCNKFSYISNDFARSEFNSVQRKSILICLFRVTSELDCVMKSSGKRCLL